jgi:flagellar hook assembly protein FlgD
MPAFKIKNLLQKITLKNFMFILVLSIAVDAAAFIENPIKSVTGSPGTFKVNKVEPRIFAPDEGNRVRFTFENPDFSEVTINIYDITGALVKKNLLREEENIMYWDGRDEDNKKVKGGIYIYQVEAGGEIVTGTIIVAK